MECYMEHQIYFVEGIPGSGKTTRVKELKNLFIQKGKNVVCIEECEKNPLDLSRCAILTQTEYECLKEEITMNIQADPQKIGKLLQILETVSEYSNDAVYVFFQSLFEKKELNSIAMALCTRDVYNGHYSFKKFREEHLKRWRIFSSSTHEEDTVYICDAILLQSPLFELMGYYELSEDSIVQYTSELISCIKDMSPMIYYNRVFDVPTAIKYTCSCRKKANDRWEQGFYKWMESSPYCQRHNYHGFDGMCTFLAKRQALELQILKRLNVPICLSNSNEKISQYITLLE